MDAYLQFLLLGIGAGAVYAGVGLGLVLAYQGSGVINFAHGGMMMYATYVYDELRDDGDYVFPVVGIPDRIHLVDGGTSFVVAVVLALLTAAALGLLVHFLVFEPLRSAPLLAKVVASVGIMIMLQAIVVLNFGSQNETVATILPNDGVDIAGARIPQDRLWLAFTVVVITAALEALYRFTRFGVATRAAAENEKGAVLMGYSPSALAAGNWVLASLVAAIFGILTAPISGLTPITYTLLVVPGLAVALIGRLRSFFYTAIAGLALGMFQSELLRIQRWGWFPEWAKTGVRE
ncbi:MAG: branched-chain amino acid ABC transporter permease, partial [Acidimicrobiia bacterium]|nr:branched-chain amino acid ABC transporter permease [Acidimicrobiia bacterium]